jgi:hypothetical protein
MRHPRRPSRSASRFAAALALLLTATAATAAPPTRESVEELLRVMRMQQTLETVFDLMEQTNREVDRQRSQLLADPSRSAEERRAIDERRERRGQEANAALREELSWDKVKDGYVRLYAETFTQEEIDGQLAFYRSPVGQAVLDKQPDLTRKSSELMQERVTEILPKTRPGLEEDAPVGTADEVAQAQTVKDIRNLGTAIFSWLTDQVAASAAADPQVVSLGDYPAISYGELRKILVPVYLQEIPEKDGWGHPYEYYLNVANPLAQHVMLIRSNGRDGKASGSSYRVGSFEPASFDDDIVWSDGFFVRWPQAEAKRQAR